MSNASELATRLIVECREVHNVDPYLLMSLVIPKSDLIRDVPWGAALYALVKTILGSKGYVLKEVVAQVQVQFLDAVPQSMGGKKMCGWKKADVVQLMETSQVPVSCPILYQILSDAGTRRHVGYEHVQDALLGYLQIMCCPRQAGFNGGCIQLMECPVPKVGNLTKFYVDVDCKLSRLDLTQAAALEMLLEMPATLGKIFVDLGVLHKRESFCVVVKEHSRMTDTGDTKVSVHLLVNLISTISSFVTLQGLIRSHVRKHCPLCIKLQEDEKAPVTKQDLLDMGIYASLAFADCHPEVNSKQGLAGPWSRKVKGMKTVSTLRETIWIENGKQLNSKVGHASVFLPYADNTGHPRHLLQDQAVRVLADTLVSVAGPRCKSFMEGSMVPRIEFFNLKPSNKTGVGSKRKLDTMSVELSSDSIWHALPAWFTSACREICGGALPVANNFLKNHISYPTGIGNRQEAIMFQMNTSVLSICPRSMMEPSGVCKTYHQHRSNGTVYLFCNGGLHVVCRDAECERTVKTGALFTKLKNADRSSIVPPTESSDGVLIDKKQWRPSRQILDRDGVMIRAARYVWLELSPDIMAFIAYRLKISRNGIRTCHAKS
jgi:hypothetical protein